MIGITPVLGFIDERQKVVTILVLLRGLEDMLDLPRIGRRQLHDVGKEPGIDGVLVPENDVGIALPDQGVEQPVFRSLLEELSPLERTTESQLELANLRQRPSDEVE